MSAKDIAKKMSENFRSIRSFKADLVMTVKGMGFEKTVRYEYIFEKPNKFYSRNLDTNDVTVCNGSVLWIYDAKRNVAYYTPLNTSLAKQFNSAEFYEKVIENLLKEYEVEIVGKDSLNGRSCYVLKLKPKSGKGELKLWVDESYWFPVKVEMSLGNVVAISEYKNIEFNVNVNDSIFNFKPPSGVVVKPLETLKVRTYTSIEDAQKHVNFTLIVPKLGELKKVSVYDDMAILSYVYDNTTFTITETTKTLPPYSNSTTVSLDGLNATYVQILNIKSLSFKYRGVYIRISTIANETTLMNFARSLLCS